MKRRLAAIVPAGIAVLYVVASFIGGGVAMRIPRLPLTASPNAVGLDCQNVSFPARYDGTLLKGWYIAGRGESVIVIVHGGFQNRVDDVVDTLGLARDLAAKGYGLLLFDLRGRGESGGRGRALSDIDSDIGGAIDFLNARGYAAQSIGIIGFCSGAAASAIYASKHSVGALVLDGSFSNVDSMVIKQAASDGIPEFLVRLFIPGLTASTRIMYGYVQTNPVDVIPAIASPMLFIHEQNDNVVSWQETTALFSASANPGNQIWQVPSASHSQGYVIDPVGYVQRIDAFFSRFLARRTQ